MVLEKHKLIREVAPSVQDTYADTNPEIPSAGAGIQPWVKCNYHITRQSDNAQQIRAQSEKSEKCRLQNNAISQIG